jgi:hypothetical protein
MNATQLEFQARQSGRTQNDRILECLKAAGEGVRVPMPKLVEISGSYVVHSRVAELNSHRGAREGWKIHNHTDCSVKPHTSVYWIEYFDADAP